MSELRGNAYAEGLEHHSGKGLELDLRDVLATALMAKTYEQRTANLIAAHQASNLIVNDADRLEIEREILHRLGVRDDA